MVSLTMPQFLLANSEKTKHPNIIFIMTDDMGYGDNTVYNMDSKIPTPNMEKLASQGVTFTDAHSPSAVCTPTRYSLLTGRYCWRTRLWRGVFGGFNRPLIEKERVTIASLLKKHGYATACIGKWHLGMDWTTKDGTMPPVDGGFEPEEIDFARPITEGPTARGFDYFFGTAGCTTDDPPFCFIENHHTLGIPELLENQDPFGKGRAFYAVEGWEHEDADIAFKNRTVWFINEHLARKPEQPFFVYLPLSVPHIPWLPPDMVKGKSEAGARGDQVVLADWILGEIMEALEQRGAAENTLLIFTSDNGPREGENGHQSSGHLREGKGSIYEGGHRIPFIARWPGKIKPGTTCDEMTCFTDMMATFAAIVGDDLPNDAGEDSFNILPALLGETEKFPIRKTLINHAGDGQLAIREGHWKLIPGILGNGEQDDLHGLYNLKDDPSEQNDLWDEHPEIIERLTDTLKRQMEQGHSRSISA